jgi:hypothetical protein
VSRYSNPWAKHYQSIWEERAASPSLPHWLRVACLAYGMHKFNGHARFKPGEIALALSRVNYETGEISTPNKHAVQRAIRTAIKEGWLAKESGALCLVVPHNAIEGGLGYAQGCDLHDSRTGKAGAK